MWHEGLGLRRSGFWFLVYHDPIPRLPLHYSHDTELVCDLLTSLSCHSPGPRSFSRECRTPVPLVIQWLPVRICYFRHWCTLLHNERSQKFWRNQLSVNKLITKKEVRMVSILRSPKINYFIKWRFLLKYKCISPTVGFRKITFVCLKSRTTHVSLKSLLRIVSSFPFNSCYKSSCIFSSFII